MKKEEMTTVDFLLEAVGIVAAMIYLGLQIYYGIVYGVAFTGIILNAAILILVYVGLTLLAHYPERVNNLPKEICSGKIRIYTIHMVRAVKLIRPRLVLPMHYNTFPAVTIDVEKAKAAFSAADIKLLLPAIGESIEL